MQSLEPNVLNVKSYKVLVSLSMLYMMFMLCNAILTNRYIGTDTCFVLGGTFTSPFIFILDDIIAEIYGYKLARYLIFCGFIVQTLCVLIFQIVLHSSAPLFFNGQAHFAYVLGSTLLRIDISGFIAYITANLLNAYILTRWKILLRGRHFWLRSLGASVFSEAFYSFLAILMMELQSIPMNNILQVAALSFLIKCCYNIIFAWPMHGLVQYIKMATQTDIYDVPSQHLSFEYDNPG